MQVRRKGHSISETFVRHDDAKRWGVDAERAIDRGQSPVRSKIGKLQTFGDLIDLHITDMKEVGKAPGRSKHATLDMLKRRFGRKKFVEIDRECIVKFGRDRSKEGAGPTTIGIGVGVIKLVMQHAAAVHGLPVLIEPIDLDRIALKRLGLPTTSMRWLSTAWSCASGCPTTDGCRPRALRRPALRCSIDSAALQYACWACEDVVVQAPARLIEGGIPTDTASTP